MTKILLVEDDKSLREIYGVRLLAEGYDIVSAGDGEEALAMAIKERPALILSDVMMPKISGFDMLDILRSTTETKDIKVIMMTALSSEDQRQRGEKLGADRYLVKSQVGIEDVVRTVHAVLGDLPGMSSPVAAPVANTIPNASTAQPMNAQAPSAAMPTPQPQHQDPMAATQQDQPQANQQVAAAPTLPPEPHLGGIASAPSSTQPFSSPMPMPRPTPLEHRALQPIPQNSPSLNDIGKMMEQEISSASQQQTAQTPLSESIPAIDTPDPEPLNLEGPHELQNTPQHELQNDAQDLPEDLAHNPAEVSRPDIESLSPQQQNPHESPVEMPSAPPSDQP